MPLLFREQTLLTEVLSQMRVRLPINVLGFDTDNDSVFMNTTVKDYCVANRIEFTRSRPYRKNDQAWGSRCAMRPSQCIDARSRRLNRLYFRRAHWARASLKWRST